LWLIIACILSLVLAITGLYYYKKRYKKAIAKLTYEMSDVRNANVIAPVVEEMLDDKIVEENKPRYSGLIEEKSIEMAE